VTFAAPRRPRGRGALVAVDLVIYVLSFVVVLLFEHLPEMLREGEPGQPVHSDAASASHFYQRFVTLGFRSPRPHYTALVALGPGLPDRVRDNPCPQRQFLGDLLLKLATIGPAEIVIDKWFPATGCLEKVPNKHLLDAISTVGKTIPIVVGFNEYTVEEAKTDFPAGLALVKGIEQDPILIAPDVFGNAETPKRGLVRLNADQRKVPTHWTALRPSEKSSEIGSISLVAASNYDPFLSATRRWATLEKGRHPYTGFIAEGAFLRFSAADLMNTKISSDERCSSATPASPSCLRHRIVVIGQELSRDHYSSPVGQIFGFALQANYIESLLDDRVVFPVDDRLEFALAILWCLVIHTFFHVWHERPWLAVVSSVAFIATAAFGVYLVTTIFGYYIRAWPGSLLVVVLRSLTVGVEHLHKRWRHS
jgi:hypothetical protein